VSELPWPSLRGSRSCGNSLKTEPGWQCYAFSEYEHLAGAQRRDKDGKIGSCIGNG